MSRRIPTIEDYGAYARPEVPSVPVSVVTACLDPGAELATTIASVGDQGLGVEYIVVDGDSQDGSPDLARASRVVNSVLCEPDRGISDAFNKGIAIASGDLIGLLNAGDTFLPGALKAVMNCAREHPGAIICGPVVHRFPDGDRIRFSSDPSALRREMTVQHPSVFVPTEVYRRIGLFRLELKLAMDYDFLLRAMLAGIPFMVVDVDVAEMEGSGVSVVRWRDAYREARDIKISYGLPRWRARLYHRWMVVRRQIRERLEASGASGLVDRVRGMAGSLAKERL